MCCPSPILLPGTMHPHRTQYCKGSFFATLISYRGLSLAALCVVVRELDELPQSCVMRQVSISSSNTRSQPGGWTCRIRMLSFRQATMSFAATWW